MIRNINYLAPSRREISFAASTTHCPISRTLESGSLMVGPDTDIPATASP
jgi:hypothetical protein